MTNKAQAIYEDLQSIMGESVVTKSDMPDIELKIKDMMVNGTRLNVPQAPHLTTVNFEGNQYQIQQGDHPEAPIGLETAISGSKEAIQKLLPSPSAPISQTAK